MVDGIQAGFMPVSGGIVSTKPTKRPDQILRDRAEQRRIVREEMRRDELRTKAKTTELTKDEKVELTVIEMRRLAEQMAERPPVVYLA